MKIAADFSQRVVVHSESLEWIPSPMPGVDRKPLDRVGGEVARATSIVRYAPGSEFSPHVHTGGEEFIVLDGVFQDEHGDFPTGSYIRNPPQSRHQPSSRNGCVIFVKLWQFQMEDRTQIRLQTDFMANIAHPDFSKVAVTPLYKDAFEEVSLLYFEPEAEISLNVKGGAELLVLEGTLDEQSDTLVKHSWLRVPINSEIKAKAGNKGAKVWLKTGHLVDVDKQISRVQNA
ncbi:cupin domain-containing protein [Paraglaciecola arctica]|uniref:Anti-ECFsigma factor, ChrR n=1 Tax=Paraglaciecola arctica BSs20135 TaxID=493475 RepID=K6Z382_9ALTE|nr:cupin domain-containing protein [Paraglaciecola arctica]GAC17885.1 anti-ECFsigma factor, ChrR [Paraglaciecola arctica BSs20135]